MPLILLVGLYLDKVDDGLNKMDMLTPIEWTERIGYFAVLLLIL
jgi:hypothetical protein